MFLRYFKRDKADNLVGLDIGSDTIKLLAINVAESPYKVENFAILPTPKNAIINGEIKDYAALSAVIKDLFRQADVKTKFVALAIPRSLAIIKNIHIDNRFTPAEIESRAWIEANRHFPDLVGDIYLDFLILGPSIQDSSQLELMLIACRKNQINPYLKILHEAALTTKIVDLSSYALERALSLIKRSPDLETVALLNIDYALSTLIVVQGEKIIYTHDQSYDGHRLMAQLDVNGPITDEVSIKILKETLSLHLRHTMHFFYSSRPNINIQKIILSGDCAHLPNLVLFTQQEIGVEAAVANPFMNMVLASQIDAEKLRGCAPSLMLCCGLALCQAN